MLHNYYCLLQIHANSYKFFSTSKAPSSAKSDRSSGEKTRVQNLDDSREARVLAGNASNLVGMKSQVGMKRAQADDDSDDDKPLTR
jgi:hypothetical protein